MLWFLRDVACNSLACMSRFEIGSLGLQRSWGVAERSVARIACDLWVVRRVDRTPVFVCRPKGAAYHTWGCVRLVRVRFAALLDEAVVARVGNQHRCSVRMVSDWGWRCWLGCGRKSPAMMGLWYVSWLVVWV